METKNLGKKYKRVLINGFLFLGIGIVLILVAGGYAMTMTAVYIIMFSLAFFCVGGGLLVTSRGLKRRMGKIEES